MKKIWCRLYLGKELVGSSYFTGTMVEVVGVQCCGVTLISPLTVPLWPRPLKSYLGNIPDTVGCRDLMLGRGFSWNVCNLLLLTLFDL